MSFWTPTSGAVIDGSAKNSHIMHFPIIPDNTQAIASIKSIEEREYHGLRFYMVTYKIIGGDFGGREVRQKIKCFETEPKKRDRALNMLMRLFSICNNLPAHTNQPQDEDFIPCLGKTIGIKIKEWFDPTIMDVDKQEGNYVAEIHSVDDEFQVATGVKSEHMAKDLSSALTRNMAHRTANIFTDDIPF